MSRGDLAALALGAASLACAAPSPAPPSAAAGEAVRALLEDQRVAWNAGDLDAFVTGYWQSPEVVFASRDGVRLGSQDLLARYREAYPDRAAMGTLSFDPPALSDLGDEHVVAQGAWRLEREDGPRAGRYVLVLRRIEGRWRIVLDYTTLTEGG